MRPQVFVLGLAFVTTVLIANVNALNCFFAVKGKDVPGCCPDSVDQCFYTDDGRKGCARDSDCYDNGDGERRIPKKGVQCCRDDYCNVDRNDAATSTLPVPLLIAVIASAITVLGI